jgi:hypothetical protein
MARKMPAGPAPQGSRYSDQRVYVAVESLAELTGPPSGTVILDTRLDWSGSPVYDLDKYGDVVAMYQTVLNEAPMSTTCGVGWTMHYSCGSGRTCGFRRGCGSCGKPASLGSPPPGGQSRSGRDRPATHRDRPASWRPVRVRACGRTRHQSTGSSPPERGRRPVRRLAATRGLSCRG